MRFTRLNRVHLAKDFEFIKKNSTKADCSAFVCYIMPVLERNFSRVAIVASKRVGNAVVRNTARRRFRAIFRENAKNFPIQCDVLIFVRRGFSRFEYENLSQKFQIATKRILKS